MPMSMQRLVLAGVIVLSGMAVAAEPLAATPSALSESEIRIEPPPNAADATPIIAAAVERAIGSGARRLVLAPGVYHLLPEQMRERFVNVSNHDDGLRRTAFPIWGARGLEIDGNGARLVMHGQPVIGLMIYDSQDVVIRHLSIDWNQPLFAQGTVVAVNATDHSFEADFLPESQARLQDGQIVFGDEAGTDARPLPYQFSPGRGWRQNLQWPHWLDSVTRRPLPLKDQLSIRMWNPRLQRASEAEQIGPNRFRLRYAVDTLPAIGSAFVTKGTLMPNRMSPAIHVANCGNITLEDVVVHQAGGMGLIAESSENITLRRYQVRLPPNSGRLLTTTADGSHFCQCRGSIVVEDCYFENMMDDALNVHGVHAIVDGAPGDDCIGIRLSHFQQLGMDFARPGERLRFCSADTLLPYAERTVRAVRPLNVGYYELKLTEPIRSALQPHSIVENADRQPDLVFRGNTVRNNRARSVLVTTAGHVLIEKNRFDHSNDSAILIEGDAHVWYESGAIADVVIRDNLFEPCDASVAVLRISPKQPGVTAVQPPYHRNLRIERNEFRVGGPRLVDANRVAGLHFHDNTVSPADWNPGQADAPGFRLRACEDVSIKRNRISLPQPVRIEAVTPIASLKVEANEGLSGP